MEGQYFTALIGPEIIIRTLLHTRVRSHSLTDLAEDEVIQIPNSNSCRPSRVIYPDDGLPCSINRINLEG